MDNAADGDPSGPMVVCTEGVLVCTGGAEDAPDVKGFDLYGNEVELPEVPFEERYQNMPWQWAHHCRSKEPVHPMLTLDQNIEVMAVLDAVIRASHSGKTSPYEQRNDCGYPEGFRTRWSRPAHNGVFQGLSAAVRLVPQSGVYQL